MPAVWIEQSRKGAAHDFFTMKRIFLIATLAALSTFALSSAAHAKSTLKKILKSPITVLSVAPNGPLKSLAEARDAIRALKAKGPLAQPVVVYIAAGTYPLTEPVTFTPQDSGTTQA